MQPSLGRRVITEHGLISNVLVCLGLVSQLTIANICARTYRITVPWNTRPVKLPIDPLSDFPSLMIPSADHVCKRVKATIESEEGIFYGIVCKSSSLPDGYGVFVSSGWVHFGKVKDGVFQKGRKVSGNKDALILKLTNQKFMDDGSVLKIV